MAGLGGWLKDEEADLLRDRADVMDLVHTYALYVRRGRGAACRDLFTADASYEMFDVDPVDLAPRLRTRLEGRDAIADYVGGASRPDMRVCPMIHNLLVTLDGEEAEGSCMMTAVTLPGGGELVGEYRDTFRRVGGAWHFASRAHTILLRRPASGPAPREGGAS